MSDSVTPQPYTYFADLAGLMVEAPSDSIISRTIYKDDGIKVILFGFAAGQTLSEHTAAVPAIIHILSGEATIGLGDSTHEARAGAWMHMAPRLTHSVLAHTPLTMLLIMLPHVPAAPEA